MIRVLALDPGLNTGWALFEVPYHGPTWLVDQGVISDGVEGFIAARREVEWADVVVYEDFEIDGTITGSWASEVIGAVKLQVAIENEYAVDTELVRQRRQDKASLFGHKAKTIQTRETERFNWLRERGFEGVSHELDAITHGLVYIKRQDHVPTIKKYWTEWKWLDESKTTSIRTLYEGA